MKKTSWLLSGSVAALSLSVGCGWSSPENFAKKSAKLSCQYTKKCEEDDWDESGFDNVRDCRDELADDDAVEAFADACKDFDKKSARQCLAGARKAKRSCDLDAPSDEQQEACAKVCGELDIGELMREEGKTEVMARILEDALEISEELREDENYEPPSEQLLWDLEHFDDES